MLEPDVRQYFPDSDAVNKALRALISLVPEKRKTTKVPNRAGNLIAKQRGQEYTEDDARWDALLATEESQRLLEKLADEALSEIQARQARLRWSPGFG